MKKKHTLSSLIVALPVALLLSVAACGNDDDAKDMTYPEIVQAGITANPVDCQVYQLGSTIAFNYVFTDDTELGAFNIEIHTNADHHTHSTSSIECEEEEDDDHHQEQAGEPWVFNQSYTIPSGLRSYNARLDIPIPADKAPGDYHFMIRLTDRAGWQQLHAVAIKLEP